MKTATLDQLCDVLGVFHSWIREGYTVGDH